MNDLELLFYRTGIRLGQTIELVNSLQREGAPGDIDAAERATDLLGGALDRLSRGTSLRAEAVQQAVNLATRVRQNLASGRSELHRCAENLNKIRQLVLAVAAAHSPNNLRVADLFMLGTLLPRWSAGAAQQRAEPQEPTLESSTGHVTTEMIQAQLAALHIERHVVYPPDPADTPAWIPFEIQGWDRLESGLNRLEEQRPSRWISGPMDLFLDERARVVRRGTREEEVSLGAVDFNLLRRLSDEFPGRIGRGALAQDWATIGTRRVAAGTVSDAVSGLRDSLRPLGVGIDESRSEGYLLTAVPQVA